MNKHKEKEVEQEKETAVADIVGVTPKCKMLICEDEKTGELVITYGKGCPKGTIERVAGKIATQGVRFSKSEQDGEI